VCSFAFLCLAIALTTKPQGALVSPRGARDSMTPSPRQQGVTFQTSVEAGSADSVSGTERPYAYFRRHFDQGASWTFVVQNRVPHCCIMNAKSLVLEWVDAVAVRRLSRPSGSYGFIETRLTDATDCPEHTSPIRPSWCRSTKDAWNGANWSVTAASITRSQDPPAGMIRAGWLPTRTFANEWRSFVTQPDHPATLPP